MNLSNLYEEMMGWDGDEAEFEIARETIQPGRSFSGDAMDGLAYQLMCFIGTRVMRRWDATTEPPTVLRVTITVSVQ